MTMELRTIGLIQKNKYPYLTYGSKYFAGNHASGSGSDSDNAHWIATWTDWEMPDTVYQMSNTMHQIHWCTGTKLLLN